MNKKEYIKPFAKHTLLACSALLAGSTVTYAGNDGGAGEAESKGNSWSWNDDED